ncbi:MAG: hypothetical protein HY432_00245 [Candidatus Liptonbacteria bacterium]|nr:hypothetical protein [Candidatus Liptonbacteria bacterium]
MNTVKSGIVAFAFGRPASISSNRRIAEIAAKNAREFKAPICTQLDIELSREFDVHRAWESPDKPPPTLRLARTAAYWATERGITHLWIVAAKPHLWRCERDLKYAIREAEAKVEVDVLEEVFESTSDEWFCQDSSQKHTRSRKEWEKRERILKITPLFLYNFLYDWIAS